MHQHVWKAWRQRGTGVCLAVCLLLQPVALSAAALTNNGESYEDQAAGKLRQSNELQQKIDNVSEEKRAIDEAADAAIKEHQARKAELDATEARMKENEDTLQGLQKDYDDKRQALGKRVRDIYIHGQISYLDVLFGAKDFNDLMTRMDLLKRIIRRDYNLVTEVAAVKDQLELAQAELEKDRETQAEQESRAHKARLDMEEKVGRQQALIERLKTDKALIDQQYEELMAASHQVGAMIRERGDGGVQASGSGAMIWPISGPVTSEFGWRVHPITGSQRFHSGVDIGGDYGQSVHAAQSGTVEYAGWISGYGNAVIINHGGGITTLYGHNQSLAVSEGQSVSQGQTIAYCGSTGNSTGPHCHFEVRRNGEPVSPYSYL
ncbi:murein hydrolase activator EnvC [uncultured Mitsuokella sp.]|uniref:murein hydrolase activator EnvC family protein n=1 Tax=uncultured Mitsuokella sp. TaxID=453120 RepID=UPI0026DBA5F5|nr:M23 family metallopeptidase [uncultured Mitsuokella sp.]